jgi:hypothetical protein
MDQINQTIATVQAVAEASTRVTNVGHRVVNSFGVRPADAAGGGAAFFLGIVLLIFAIGGAIALTSLRALGWMHEYAHAASDAVPDAECDEPSSAHSQSAFCETVLGFVCPSLLEEFLYCALLFNALCAGSGTPWPGEDAYPVALPWDTQSGFVGAWLATLATSTAVQIIIAVAAQNETGCGAVVAVLDCSRCPVCCCCCVPRAKSISYAGWWLFWRADLCAIKRSQGIAFVFVVGGAVTRLFCTFVYYYAGCILWPGVALRLACLVLFRVGYGRYEHDASNEDAAPTKITCMAAHALNAMPTLPAPPRLDVGLADPDAERSLL